VAAVALALAGVARPDGLPWYVPDRVKLQYAGNIGFVSPGVGWGAPRVETDLFFGWVPYAVAGEDVVSVTGKVTWLPWREPLGRRWLVRPITLGLQLTYTFGSEFYLTLPSRYRPHYYDFPTAVRAGITLGGTLGRRTDGGRVREVGVYWELVGLDLMLFEWARNPSALGPADVFSLALGVRAAF
jgi:hypothetical protein